MTLQQLSGYLCFNCGTMTPMRPAIECCDNQFSAAVFVRLDADSTVSSPPQRIVADEAPKVETQEEATASESHQQSLPQTVLLLRLLRRGDANEGGDNGHPYVSRQTSALGATS